LPGDAAMPTLRIATSKLYQIPAYHS
jgi:hypothetical protein